MENFIASLPSLGDQKNNHIKYVLFQDGLQSDISIISFKDKKLKLKLKKSQYKTK